VNEEAVACVGPQRQKKKKKKIVFVFDWISYIALKATSDVLMVLKKKNTDVWGVMSCRLVETYRRFRATRCL